MNPWFPRPSLNNGYPSVTNSYDTPHQEMWICLARLFLLAPCTIWLSTSLYFPSLSIYAMGISPLKWALLLLSNILLATDVQPATLSKPNYHVKTLRQKGQQRRI